MEKTGPIAGDQQVAEENPVPLGHGPARPTDRHRKWKRPVRNTKVFRKMPSKSGVADSTPMMVADFVFRKQIDWLVENTGVRDDFKDIALKIWFSYLSRYMPDLENGIRNELGGNKQWHLAFPQGDLTALLHCSRQELGAELKNLQRQKAYSGEKKTPRLSTSLGKLKPKSIISNFKCFRPTPVLLIAIIGIALYVCQEDVLISDLLRWARLLKLPLVDLLPFKGEASAAELRGVTEKSRTPHGVGLYSLIEKWFVWLANTLLDGHIAKLPGLPVAPFVERFIEELNLPFEMVPFVLGLLKRINSLEYRIESISIHRAPLASSRRTMNVESHIMCCIFYALCFLFVLDNSTENRISDITEDMQAIQPALNLFSLRIWYQHLKHRRMLLFKHTMLSRKTQSAQTYTDFIQTNLVSRSVSKAKVLASYRSTNRMRNFYRDLQLSFRKEDASKPCALSIDLGVTSRPYRAHTEALSEYYPELAVDFGKQSIKHLLEDNGRWSKTHGLDAKVELIRNARKLGYQHAQPLRSVRNDYRDKKNVVEKEYVSSVTRGLVGVMAEMTEQRPGTLFGYLLFLEIAFFPTHPSCSYMAKKNNQNLKAFRTC